MLDKYVHKYVQKCVYISLIIIISGFYLLIDQLQPNAQKVLETIGAELLKQYERWQPRARYKQCLDPTTEEVKKLCMSLRKNAKVRWLAGDLVIKN